MAFKTYPLFALIIIVVNVFAKDVRKLCLSSLANKSCGQCIKQHPDCAWCLDPHLIGAYRCDHKKEFEGGKCSPSLIYSPSTEVKITPQHNLPLGNKHADGSTLVQLEPQQVVLRMKPGDIVEVPFKYLHAPLHNIKDFVIQTSEFRSLGVGIEFSIICGGKKVSGRQCTNVNANDRIEFFAKVSLNECKSGGDIAISIGAYGYQTVSAMYITPVCGCDCEKVQNQERRSSLCYNSGDLICGVCECQPDKGGNHCECDLQKYGVSTAEQLDNKCRRKPGDAICGGNGQCRCGRCQCNAEHVTGEFCDCEGMSCPEFDGKLCAGQGECSCGKCRCEESFTGDDCSCTLDTSSCTEGNVICNGHGTCECGKCVCNEGYTGVTCGIANAEELDEQTASLEESEDAATAMTTTRTTTVTSAEDSEFVDDEAELEEHNEVADDEHDDTDDGGDDEQQQQQQQQQQTDSNDEAGEVLPPADDSAAVDALSTHESEQTIGELQSESAEVNQSSADRRETLITFAFIFTLSVILFV